MCRSDIPYAALWGEDPIPDRSHVLLATWLKPDTRFKPLGEQLSTKLVSLHALQMLTSTSCCEYAACFDALDEQLSKQLVCFG